MSAHGDAYAASAVSSATSAVAALGMAGAEAWLDDLWSRLVVPFAEWNPTLVTEPQPLSSLYDAELQALLELLTLAIDGWPDALTGSHMMTLHEKRNEIADEQLSRRELFGDPRTVLDAD